MKRLRAARWSLLLTLSGGVGAGYFIAMRRPIRGSILASYPFQSSDSYDWLLQAFVLERWLDGIEPVILPVLRAPVFVGISLLDFLLEARGRVVLLAIAASIAVMCGVLVLAARALRGRAIETLAVIVLCLAFPAAFFRPFALADQVATTLMIGAVACFIPFSQKGGPRWVITGGVIATLGGLTQLYAVVPFLIVGCCLALARFRTNRFEWFLGGTLVGVVVATTGLMFWWQAIVPHAFVPNHLDHLGISLGMASFYFNAWGFGFLVLVPLTVILIAKARRRVLSDPLVIGCWIAVLSLAGATFFYQWRDFRLSMPLSVMLSLTLVVTLGDGASLERRVSRTAFSATAIAALAIATVVAPASYWVPRLSELEIAPTKTFIGRLVTAQPNDRFGILTTCGPTETPCAAWRVPHGLTGYQTKILETWEQLAVSQNSPSSDPSSITVTDLELEVDEGDRRPTAEDNE